MHRVTYLYTFIWDIPCWLVLLLMYSLWGTKLHWNNGLWFELKEKSWPARSWYKGWGGTTFGHGGFFAPKISGGKGVDTAVEFHEHIHIEQYEAGMLRAFLIALAMFATLLYLEHLRAALAVGFSLWFLGPLLTWIPNWLQAAIRGEQAYLGSHHEEAARAITEQEFPSKK